MREDSAIVSPGQAGIYNNLHSKSEYATVIYYYDAKEEDELTLRVGDVIEVLSKDKEVSGDDGWWLGRGEVNGEKFVGVFPANYVIGYTGGAKQKYHSET